MYCSRRLYKGDSYQICLPIADTGVTSVRFYTSGDMVIEKEGEFIDDMMCFELTKEELDLLPDGVLRYTYDGFDSNTEYVVVTPGDYSGSTLDDLLEEAFDSGYTAGQEDCSGCTGNDDLIANLQGDYFVIPEGTTRLRDGVFSYARNISAMTIPSSVREIGDAFLKGTGIKSITIPDSVESIGNTCFMDSELQEATLSNSLSTIGPFAFCNCMSLTAVTLPSGLTSIPTQCFDYATSLPSIDIPTTVTRIGGRAFYVARNLTGITFPAALANIESNAFMECSSLQSMTFEGTTPPSINTGNSLGNIEYTFPIYVPCQSLEDYKTAFGQYYAPRITCSGSPEPVYSAMPMTFRVISGGTLSWYNGQESFGNDYSYCELKYRVNGGEWGTIANNNSSDPEHIASSITLSSGDYVEFATDRINYSLVNSTSGIHFKFKASSALRYNVEGNIMSIVYPIGEFETATSYPESYGTNWFAELFAIENTQEEGGVVDASRLVLPVTALTPACYQDMFYQCAHLVSAPALPATTLAGYCYQEMFMGCTSLTSAPELPAPVLTDWCYAQMFSNCPSLNFVKCLATDISVNDCTVDWLNGVPAEGTFEKAPGMTSWPSGDSGIPTGWTVVDAT